MTSYLPKLVIFTSIPRRFAYSVARAIVASVSRLVVVVASVVRRPSSSSVVRRRRPRPVVVVPRPRARSTAASNLAVEPLRLSSHLKTLESTRRRRTLARRRAASSASTRSTVTRSANECRARTVRSKSTHARRASRGRGRRVVARHRSRRAMSRRRRRVASNTIASSSAQSATTRWTRTRDAATARAARSTRGAKRGARAALVGALAASRIAARLRRRGVETPPLNAHVSARARVASAGMDPNIEATAAAWFANLGFRVLEGATATTRGAWGGTARESDARFATSYCLDASTNTSALEDYDFVGWLPVSNAIEDVMSDRADFKVVLFETMATEWWEHARTRAESAKALGDACGCGAGATRSTASTCGNEDYHYCDIYPCVWERAFGSATPDEETWKTKYIERVREIKSAAPPGRLLTIPMTAAPVGHATAVKVSKLIAQFLEITDDLDAFGEAYPFLRRDLTRRRAQQRLASRGSRSSSSPARTSGSSPTRAIRRGDSCVGTSVSARYPDLVHSTNVHSTHARRRARRQTRAQLPKRRTRATMPDDGARAADHARGQQKLDEFRAQKAKAKARASEETRATRDDEANAPRETEEKKHDDVAVVKQKLVKAVKKGKAIEAERDAARARAEAAEEARDALMKELEAVKAETGERAAAREESGSHARAAETKRGGVGVRER